MVSYVVRYCHRNWVAMYKGYFHQNWVAMYEDIFIIIELMIKKTITRNCTQ